MEEYDRTHAPILWPAALNDDGTVNRDWSEEMLRIRRLFWEPLGATMVWHYADGRN